MWSCEVGFPVRGVSTPPPNPSRWKSRAAVYSPLSEEIKKKNNNNNKKKKKNQFSSPDPPEEGKGDLFHVIHKVPAGNSPYVKAKQVQLIEKDPSRAISLFWKAINSGDRVDSALKDMAVVMKQLDRSDEAIEAIKSFRNLCTPDSQESLDNVLVELYKRSGRLEEQIDLLQYKLKCIDEGIAFGGKRTKTARSQGKKIQITLVQERSRLLGNLAWAHLQKNNFSAAEELYREALSLEEDMNKQCNLAICWMHMDRMPEARSLLNKIRAYSGGGPMEESYAKSFERAYQVFCELESKSLPKTRPPPEQGFREVPCQPFPTPSKTPSKEGCLWVSRDWRDAHEEGTVCIDEHNRGGFLFRDQHLINDNLCGFGGQIKEVGHSENSKERIRSTYPRENGCWVNLSGIGDVSVTKRTHASPESIRGIEKFPVTEPARRTSSWESNNRPCNRKGGCRDASIRAASRKLSFDQSMSSGIQEVAALGMPQNTSLPSDGDWGRTWRENEAVIGTSSLSSAVVGATRKLSFDQVISSTQKAAALGTPKKCSPTIGDGGRRSIWRENEAVIDIMSQPSIVNGNWKRGSEFQIKEVVSVSSNGSWNNKDSEVQIKEDNLSGNGSVSGNGIAETLQERNSGNPKPTGSSSSAQENKKSWADMVEEDEKELCDEDPNENSWDWNNGDDQLHNENLNFNIIHQNLSPGSDPENNLNRQLKALDVKDGGAVSSRNPSHYSLPHQADQRFSSPPQALNLDGYTYILASERECRGGSATTTSDIELWKRKRLPVFRDITLLPESPRA